MTGRPTPTWTGKSPASVAPPRVRLRIFQAYDGRCGKCGQSLRVTAWELDHILALINGGANSEANLMPLCSPCHKVKTKVDVKAKSVTYKKALKHSGAVKKKGWGGAHAKFKRKMDGTVVPRGEK